MDYQSLKRIVIYHDKLYYDEGRPILDDSEYDAMFDQLVELEKHQGWKDPDSPTIRISASGKVKHPHPLYSLKKVYNEEDIPSGFDIELPKLDGVNLSVTYSSGALALVLTRGNGETGESVVHLSRIIAGIPLSVDSSYTFVGEVVTDNKEVENFRNYVAGALGLKSAKEAASRNLRFIVHDVLGMPEDYLERMKYARSVGFSTIDVGDYSQYPQDGVVYRVKTYAQELEMGYTAKYPRFAVALKKKEHFSAATYLTNIEWAIGRSGVVTPVGIVDPVVLDGATVSRVILHNIEFIESHGLRRGDMILIERRITPQFVRVLQSSKYAPFTIEDAIAGVGQPVFRKGPKLFVESEDGYRLVEHYVKSMGIKGIGAGNIRKMDIVHPSELYNRTDWYLLGKVGESIQEELNRPKPYSQILGSLGIPGVGKSTAELIVAKIPDFKDLRKIANTAIPRIGPATIEKILSWLEVNEEWVLNLPYELSEVIPETKDFVKKVVISGKLDMTKSQLAEHLKKHKIVVVEALTKDCYALISGGDVTGKTKQAEKNGIPIINYWNNRAQILKGMI